MRWGTPYAKEESGVLDGKLRSNALQISSLEARNIISNLPESVCKFCLTDFWIFGRI